MNFYVYPPDHYRHIKSHDYILSSVRASPYICISKKSAQPVRRLDCVYNMYHENQKTRAA